MPRQRADESGQYQETASDGDILQHIADFHRPFVTSSEVMAEFDFGRTSINNRLNELAKGDQLNKTEVGSRAVVWWLPEDTSEHVISDTSEYVAEGRTSEYETSEDTSEHETSEESTEYVSVVKRIEDPESDPDDTGREENSALEW